MIDESLEVAEAFPELGEGVTADYSDEDEPVLRRPDGSEVDTWRENYPYGRRMSRPEYDRTKRLLQIELLKLQYWVAGTGQRMVIVFAAALPVATMFSGAPNGGRFTV